MIFDNGVANNKHMLTVLPDLALVAKKLRSGWNRWTNMHRRSTVHVHGGASTLN